MDPDPCTYSNNDLMHFSQSILSRYLLRIRKT